MLFKKGERWRVGDKRENGTCIITAAVFRRLYIAFTPPADAKMRRLRGEEEKKEIRPEGAGRASGTKECKHCVGLADGMQVSQSQFAFCAPLAFEESMACAYLLFLPDISVWGN